MEPIRKNTARPCGCSRTFISEWNCRTRGSTPHPRTRASSGGDPDPDNGHCVAGVGYNSQGVVIDTWGMTGLLTDAAIAKYATKAAHDGLYTVVSTDAINNATQKAPNGFDWS